MMTLASCAARTHHYLSPPVHFLSGYLGLCATPLPGHFSERGNQ